MADNKEGKIPIPRLPSTRPKQPKRPKVVDAAKAAHIEQQKEANKLSKKALDKTRIYIGSAIQRWNNLKQQKGIRTNPEFALLLLD